MNRPPIALSFSNRILVGLGAGILLGLFLGERAAALRWAADGFVKLLQMTVLPYVTVSIVGSLGRLDYVEARTLGKRAGAVLVGLWLVALIFALLMPLTFPRATNASFFSTTLAEEQAPFDFIGLYIPSNPFYALANNIVPAVVIFSVILGVALIGVERKGMLLDVLQVASDALSRATRLVVRLTPYGLLAIAAVATGTLSVEQIGRLQVYLVAYVAMALLLSLWVLPGLVAALTPIRAGAIFQRTRNALITAFVAGDLFIVLPVLIDASRSLVEEQINDPHAASLPDAIVPASFNFPHSGKLLSLSFVLFAGWFADAVVSWTAYPKLAFVGLVTFFGSPNAAVPFLLDLFRIPADTFQLFVASGVINSRFGTLVAAMHTVAVALLGTCAMTGLLRWDGRRLTRFLVVTTVLTATVLGGARALFAYVLQQTYSKDKVLAQMHLLQQPVGTVVHRTRPVLPRDSDDARPLLDIIRARGVLRVGYMPDALPFAFFNERDELVGFDVELVHHLARELHIRLEFLPIVRQTLDVDLSGDYCDIALTGVAMTTLRASRTLFTNSYLDETMAFIVRDEARDDFTSWDHVRAASSLRLGVINVPYYLDEIRERLPRASITPVDSVSEMFQRAGTFDALVLPAERGSAWTLIHPEYSVVIPQPGVLKVPLAIPVARRDFALASFLNTWIELKRKDGTLDTLYKYWILGQDAKPPQPRWSILRNVLRWVD